MTLIMRVTKHLTFITLALLAAAAALLFLARNVVTHDYQSHSMITQVEVSNIASAVEIYEERHGSYPSLLGDTVTDGILSNLPKDLWGRPFFYSLRRPSFTNAESDFYVWSLGRNGTPGGDGVDRDVLSWD